MLDVAFNRCADSIPSRDRAWAQELVYGTVRLRGRLDYFLAQFVKRKLESLDADVLDILRLGVYQLVEMNSVPGYAAVSQAVEMSKSGGARGASGFVNGVLQALRRAQHELKPPPSHDSVKSLSDWGSHPAWLVERWVAQFGFEGAQALINANNQKPDVFVRVIGMPRAEAVAILNAAQVDAQPVGQVNAAIRIPPSDVLRTLELLPAVVQDPAAMMVVEYAHLMGPRIFDVCAAPGGKALALSGTDAQVVAGDISMTRLQRLRENGRRIRSRNVNFYVADARQLPFRRLEEVLVDAPCTGTGTLRRHPDGKWRIKPADINALAQLQRAILEAVAALVAPGGVLVYATCSLEPEENEQQVARFLDDHSDFRLDPPDHSSMPVRDGMLRVLPHEFGFDGAFAARLRRAA